MKNKNTNFTFSKKMIVTSGKQQATGAEESVTLQNNQQGQALITLLFFVILAIIIVSAAVAIVMTNALSGSRMQEGFNAYTIAESGAENALLRLDRNLNYSGETMSIDGGTVTITATGTNPVTILSVGALNGAIKKVQVVVNINNGQLSIVSWKEVY